MLRLVTILFVLALAAVPAQATWDPQTFATESTLEFFTVSPADGEHWSTVWLVVIDGQVYVRLGSRAAERIEKNIGSRCTRDGRRESGQDADQYRPSRQNQLRRCPLRLSTAEG